MRLRVLGSGSCELRRERSSPAYVVEAGGRILLLDCGQGAWRRFVEAGYRPAELDAIVLSHHHLDHIADLLPLLFALNYDPVLRTEARMTLVADPKMAKVLEQLEAVFGRWITPPSECLRACFPAPGTRTSLGHVELRAVRAAHIDSSLAFRVSYHEASVTYLGDSLPAPELTELARGTDLLICHTVGSEEEPHPLHMHGAAAGRMAEAAQASSLLLSHFYRSQDPHATARAAAEHYGGAIILAKDLLELERIPDGGGFRELECRDSAP